MASLRKIWIGRKHQICQKGILGVQRNISGNKFPEEAKLFLTFGLWTTTFKVSGKTKMTELPKLHSMCPEIHFEKKDFFSKKNIILTSPSDVESKNSGTCQTFSPRVSQPKSTWPKKHSGKSFLREKCTSLYLFMASLRKIWLARKLQICQKGILGV